MHRVLILLLIIHLSTQLDVTIPALVEFPLATYNSPRDWAIEYLQTTGKLSNINVTFNYNVIFFSTARAVDVMISLIDTQNQTIVLGNYFSSTSSVTGVVGGVYGAAQLSATASADVLSDKSLYPYFARVIATSNAQAKAISSLIEYYYKTEGRGWDKLAIILTSNEYGISLYNAFATQIPKGCTVVATRSVLDDQVDVTFDLEEVKRSGARVIVGFFSGYAAGRIMVTAKEMGINGPGYVWVVNQVIRQQTSPAERALFLTPEYAEAIRGAICTVPYVRQSGPAWDYYLNIYNITTNGTSFPTEFETLDFDAALFAGYALDTLHEQGLLDEQGKAPADVWFKCLTSISYPDGASGPIVLNEKGDRRMDFAVINFIPERTEWHLCGIWNAENDTVNLSGFTPIVWADNTTQTPDLDIRPPFRYWSCAKEEFGFDETGKTVTLQTPDGSSVDDIDSAYECDGFIDCQNASDEAHDCSTNFRALFIAYGILTCILVLLALILIPFVIIFGLCVRRKRVTASSPTFLLIVILSCIVGLCSTFAWYGKPHPVACGFQPWLLGLSTVSLIAALSAKTFRIWRIFKSPFTRVMISDLELLALWAFLMCPAIVILFLWTLISTPTAEMKEMEGMEHYVCATGGFTGYPGGYIFFSIFVFYCVVVVGFALFLSVVTRNVPSLFNESRLIALSMYNITILAAVGIPVVIVLTEIEPFGAWIVRASAILYVFTATLVLQFVPKIVGIFVIDRCKDYQLKGTNWSGSLKASSETSGGSKIVVYNSESSSSI